MQNVALTSLESALEVLKALIDGRKKQDRNFSLRVLAKECDISVALLPLILAGKRRLTPKLAERIAKYFQLELAEYRWFVGLCTLEKGKLSTDAPSKALGKVQRSAKYRQQRPEEARFFEYFSHWHLPVLRELIALKEFKMDAHWIAENLHFDIPPGKVEKAYKFLLKEGFISESKNGNFVFPQQRQETCQGSVFKVALSEFHKSMMMRALDSISLVPHTERSMEALTMAVKKEDWPKMQNIMLKALDEISELSRNTKDRDALYHFAYYAFPFTKNVKS